VAEAGCPAARGLIHGAADARFCSNRRIVPQGENSDPPRFNATGRVSTDERGLPGYVERSTHMGQQRHTASAFRMLGGLGRPSARRPAEPGSIRRIPNLGKGLPRNANSRR